MTTENNMKADERIDVLGRFEETVMLAVMVCGPAATAKDIINTIEKKVGVTKNNVTMLTVLERLSKKGFINSSLEKESTSRKGGKRRRIFDVTSDGVNTIKKSYNIISKLAKEAGLEDVA